MLFLGVIGRQSSRSKKQSIRRWAQASGLALTLALLAQSASAQVCDGFTTQVLSFSNATLSSGTALQVGAVYDFDNLAPGIDGQVEITGFFNGGSLSAIDNDAGLTDYFQPQFVPNPAGGSYAGFRVSFINAATGLPEPITFAATQIDVDGDSQTLREFVEFDANLSQFTVNNPTEIVIDASGPSNPNLTRFESTTSATAPGIDPTAQENIVRAIYENQTSYEFTYGTLDAGATTRLASVGFDCPAISNPVNTIPQAESNLVTVKALAASSSASPEIGDTVTYEITVTNDGPAAATNIALSDALPAGLTATGNNGSVTAGTYTGGSWSINLLLNGQSATLTLEGTVDSDQGGNAITNTLTAATSDSLDPSTAGDDLTETINVQAPVIEAVDNDFTAVPFQPGSGGVTASVFDNDTLNGDPLTAVAVTASIIDDGYLHNAVINPDGTIDVPAGTAPGIYQVEYEICDVNDSTNCDTAIAIIAVQTSSPDIYSQPADCGTFSSTGWFTVGAGQTDYLNVFGTGDQNTDPYEYLPLTRLPNGKIDAFLGTPVENLTGAITAFGGTNLISTNAVSVEDHFSEYHVTVYRVDGAPGTSETVTLETTLGHEWTAYWIEDGAGSVLDSADFAFTAEGFPVAVGPDLDVTINYPTTGIAYLHVAMFDPTVAYGPPRIRDYECPAPSLSMTKVADNPGPHQVGDVITYTYTITNDGNRLIEDVAINDTHNGSDPAPTPGSETLLTDAAPTGDSTDAASDGNWDALAPGDAVTFTGTYTVTQADVDNL